MINPEITRMFQESIEAAARARRAVRKSVTGTTFTFRMSTDARVVAAADSEHAAHIALYTYLAESMDVNERIVINGVGLTKSDACEELEAAKR